MGILELWALFVLLPGAKSFFEGMGAVLLIVLLVALFLMPPLLEFDHEKIIKALKGNKKFLIVPALCLFMSAILPDEKQIAMIAGGYFATNNEEVKKLPDNVLGAVNSYLEKIQKLEQPNDQR